MMSKISAKIEEVKDDQGYIFLKVHGLWMSVDKRLFEYFLQKHLVERLYGDEHKKLDREIKSVDKEMKKLKKKGHDLEYKSKHYHKQHLEGQKKDTVNLLDLIGKRIEFHIQ